jgi:PAS domain-containing protein/two-component sensor histidine kinase
MNLAIENSVLKKIIKELSEMYFQFTFSPDKSITFDYLSEALIDFLELTDEMVKKGGFDSILVSKIAPKDLMKFNDSLNDSVENFSQWNLEFEIILPLKGFKWVKISAIPEKVENGNLIFMGKAEDITLQKINEENLILDKERILFANTASNLGVWDWNLATGEVYYSPESLEILEMDNNSPLVSTPEEWDERVHPDDTEIYFYNMNQHFEEKTPYYETYHRILCNGKYKWILDRGKVILRDNFGKPLRVVGTHTDISDQKNREENLLKTLELINSQNNKLLNFAHIVSHNLRNHTGNLSALIEMNESGMMDKEETCVYIKKVSKELTNTLANLIDLVEIQNNNNAGIKTLNVNEYLGKVFNVLQDNIDKNAVEIVNNVPPDFIVNVIPAYLESILLNLTTNAIKYSDPEKKPIIKYSVDKDQDFNVLYVKDNGLGIDLEKHKENIFGLYKTFHANEDSNGIGLHITKNQIEAMGGKIEIESKIKEGSTFKIYFK